MSGFESMFKKPTLPSKKRKLDPPIPSPIERYKSTRVGPNGVGEKHATVTDAGDEEEDDDMAGPAPPPDDDDMEYPEDDEGRLEGGGLTDREKDILDFIDRTEEDDSKEEKIDASWLRKLALNFEKKISKNAEMRAKHEDDPHKFMASEADLDADIKALAILAEHPELFEEFARLGCLQSLVGLLAHENTDIAIDVVEVIAELTGDEVEAEPEQWDVLVNGMFNAGLLEMLTQNLSRLKEGNEQDRNGIYHTLSVFENLVSQQHQSEVIAAKTNLVAWLLERIQARESPISQNKQYASEVLSIMAQTSAKNRQKIAEVGGVDVLLRILSAYRKRDPAKGEEEEEFFEDTFGVLTCMVDDEEGKNKFVEAEGVELCLIMLREGKMSKSRALRVLDHALSGAYGDKACDALVEAQGLKTIFGMFMKKPDVESTEHLLGIFASLLKNLPADSAPRIRTLAKFVEKDYEKLSKILTLRETYHKKLAVVDDQIKAERAQADEIDEILKDEWDTRRLTGGLFCLQVIDLTIAWLCAEDDGARQKVKDLLGESGRSLADVKTTLGEQIETLDESTDEGRNMKDMLMTLSDFL